MCIIGPDTTPLVSGIHSESWDVSSTDKRDNCTFLPLPNIGKQELIEYSLFIIPDNKKEKVLQVFGIQLHILDSFFNAVTTFTNCI